jgi:hypothetical protein
LDAPGSRTRSGLYDPAVLCPALVDRDGEIERLRDRVAGLDDQRGGVVVLRGDAGTSKSRLLREATTALDGSVLFGRAVPGDSPVPFRPLTEAGWGFL